MSETECICDQNDLHFDGITNPACPVHAQPASAPPAASAGGEEGFYEAVVNLVDSYRWLAEGRGPYADYDAGYDEDVKRFVRALMDLLPVERHEPWQSVLNRLTTLEAALDAARRDIAALSDGPSTDEWMAMLAAARQERDEAFTRAVEHVAQQVSETMIGKSFHDAAILRAEAAERQAEAYRQALTRIAAYEKPPSLIARAALESAKDQG